MSEGFDFAARVVSGRTIGRPPQKTSAAQMTLAAPARSLM
jgi:hypothetical protein